MFSFSSSSMITWRMSLSLISRFVLVIFFVLAIRQTIFCSKSLLPTAAKISSFFAFFAQAAPIFEPTFFSRLMLTSQSLTHIMYLAATIQALSDEIWKFKMKKNILLDVGTNFKKIVSFFMMLFGDITEVTNHKATDDDNVDFRSFRKKIVFKAWKINAVWWIC